MRPLVPSTKLAKTPQELRGVRCEPARLRPEELHRTKGLLEHANAVSRGRERQTELRELRLVPTGSDAELQTSVGQVIDGDRDLRHEPRVTVEIPRDVEAHARALRDRGHRAEGGPSVEDRCRRVGTERDEKGDGA